MKTVEIGRKYRTPFEPSGIVEVIEIEPADKFYKKPTCIVKFIGDHPAGYKNGTEGRYFCDELVLIEEVTNLTKQLEGHVNYHNLQKKRETEQAQREADILKAISQ